jgi:hypothetical protein
MFPGQAMKNLYKRRKEEKNDVVVWCHKYMIIRKKKLQRASGIPILLFSLGNVTKLWPRYQLGLRSVLSIFGRFRDDNWWKSAAFVNDMPEISAKVPRVQTEK